MTPFPFDYSLPAELIAQQPCEPRDHARLFVVDRHNHSLHHHHFYDLPNLLRPGDLLVLNDTRVLPARLLGKRARTGGKWEGLFLQELPDATWEMLCQTRGKLQEGEVIAVGPGARDDSGKLIPLDVKVGDSVLFGKWSGTEVKIDGAEILIMKESDIMGVLAK